MERIEAYFKNSYNFYKVAVEIMTYSQVNYRTAAIHIMDEYINLEIACAHTQYFNKEDMMDAIIDMDGCKNGMTWTAASWILEKYILKMEELCIVFNYPKYEIDTEHEYSDDTDDEIENGIEGTDDDSDIEDEIFSSSM